MVDTAVRRCPTVPESSWMRLLPPAARLVLHGGAEARAAARRVWPADFSEEACRAHVHGARGSLWLGPDEYLLIDLQPGAGEPGQGTLAALEQTLAGIPHALVDISHRQIALEVWGPQAADILCGGCPLDLDPAEFPVSMCTRTVFAKADVVLWRTAPDTFHVEVWRSFAGYVTGLLTEIAREYTAPR